MKALYIHIPFCNCICNYCDFYKMKAKMAVKEKYVTYLLKELGLKKEYLGEIETIYIGGGTPSSLPINYIDFFLYNLSKSVNLNNVLEFTFEANPIDINDELMQILRKYKVNRISLGVQSFDNKKLVDLGRNHTKKSAFRAIKTIRRAGIRNINVDLIYGLNTDSWFKIKRDMRRAINLDVKHLSIYSLILEERTVFSHLASIGQLTLLSPEDDSKIYKKIGSFLKSEGYKQYEISNYARTNAFSKHNLIYWNNEHYLGIGAAAAYYIDNIRYTNVMNLQKYFNGIDSGKLNYVEETILDQDDMIEEELLLGLRKITGINISDFKNKYGISIFEQYPIIIKQIEQKMLKVRRNQLFIPKKKMHLANEVLIEFLK